MNNKEQAYRKQKITWQASFNISIIALQLSGLKTAINRQRLT
jgi:hypothetical protein